MSSCSASLLGALTPMLASAAFLLPLFSLRIKNRVFYYFYSVAFATLTLAATAWGFIKVSSCSVLTYTFGGWPPPYGIAYRVDVASGLLALFTSVVMWFIVLYSVWYGKYIDDVVWYYTLLLGMESGLLGCLLTSDVFNLFVMLEALSISAYGLAAFFTRRPTALEAAFKYAFIGAVITTLYFIATVILYSAYGTLNMADLLGKSTLTSSSRFSGWLFGDITSASLAAIAFTLWVFTFKSALFPNHFWVPDVYSAAPVPVIAAFSGAVEITGVYVVARFMYTLFGAGSILALNGYRDSILLVLLVLGVASGIVGSLMMVLQKNAYRLLGYSTISHIGLLYMVLSLGMSSVSSDVLKTALTALIYHIVNFGLGKVLMISSIGLVSAPAGERDLDKLSGLSRLYPIASIGITMAVFQLIGLIPFGGFYSKLLMYQAFISGGQPILAIALILISAISSLGYFKIFYALIFPPLLRSSVKEREGVVMPIVLVLAVAVLLLGIFSPAVSKFIETVVENSLMPKGVEMYYESFTEVLKSYIGGG